MNPKHVCEDCRRVFTSERGLLDHRSRIGTIMTDCNGHISPQAKENGEKIKRTLESGALVVGTFIEMGSYTYKLEERIFGSCGSAYWSCVLVAIPARSGFKVGANYTLSEKELLDQGKIVGGPAFTPPKDDVETKSNMHLADECGKLRAKYVQAAAMLQTTSDALFDVMAWLGPTKVRDFERWREKTRK